MNWLAVSEAALAVAMASFVRGLTGFGFAIVATPLLALVYPPAIAVPVATLLQIPSGLPTVLRDWRDTDFRAAATAWIGGLPALIPGVFLLGILSADVMRLAVGGAVIFSTVALAFGKKIGRDPKPYELMGAGALSGLMQGAVAMAGPPVILLILSSSWNAARCRATLSFVFLLLGTASLVFGTIHGIVTKESILIAAVTVPGLLLGQMVGSHLFQRIDAKRYRSISTICVAVTGALVVIRGLMSFL
ncbi:sulfite exporter TauE/SafE family protein [Bradyrhizobium sp. NP1]|uniref:sulfite exporter TauE/SafE family protein n=1 Tax=Bradyrhizobium sp. NP1 TaxID=3049772 RepID=UPI0025A5BFB8|nr:sulfite exporter TauE/SafE family protein [Bradyrhizobium sp. NP1]WJR75865.1 sulfite exporter TauE/SafE family protein [Bradyrhizobium sp. NP1]